MNGRWRQWFWKRKVVWDVRLAHKFATSISPFQFSIQQDGDGYLLPPILLLQTQLSQDRIYQTAEAIEQHTHNLTFTFI